MSKNPLKVLSFLKSNLRGSAIAMAAAVVCYQHYFNMDYDDTHREMYKNFTWLYSVCFITVIVQFVAAVLALFKKCLPGCLVLICELLADIACAIICISAGSATIEDCGEKLGQPCWSRPVRVSMYLTLTTGILCLAVLVLTALKR